LSDKQVGWACKIRELAQRDPEAQSGSGRQFERGSFFFGGLFATEETPFALGSDLRTNLILYGQAKVPPAQEKGRLLQIWPSLQASPADLRLSGIGRRHPNCIARENVRGLIERLFEYGGAVLKW